jgi:MFS family permease
MTSRLLADITPLRSSPAFRRLWVGGLLSGVGSQMTVFAVALQVFLITHSPAAVGVVGLFSAVPAIAFGLFAGSLADALDRRRLALITCVAQTSMSAVLAAQAFAGGRSVALLYAVVAVQSLAGSLGTPARRAFLPRLLPNEQLAAAAALTMLAMHTSLVTGPALAGVVAAAGGLKLCYAVDAASFVASFYGLWTLPAMRPDGTPSRPGLRSVLEGLRFLRSSQVLAGALLADLNATVLAMPVALFPAVNAERFGGSPRTLGLLTTAMGVGGVLGSALSGPVGRVHRQGRAMLMAGACWGAALAAFGLVDGLAATLATLVLASAADVSSVVLRTAIIQTATPDEYRGRISAAEFVVGGACPQLGNFRAGGIASLASPNISAISGGLACVVGAGLLAAGIPAFRRYGRSPTPVDAQLAAEAAP